MPVPVRDFASKLGVDNERVISMLAEAGVTDKTAESILTDEEKRLLMRHMHKGRLRSAQRPNTQQVHSSGRGSARPHDTVVTIKDAGPTLKPRRPVYKKSVVVEDGAEPDVVHHEIQNQEQVNAVEATEEATQTVEVDKLVEVEEPSKGAVSEKAQIEDKQSEVVVEEEQLEVVTVEQKQPEIVDRPEELNASESSSIQINGATVAEPTQTETEVKSVKPASKKEKKTAVKPVKISEKITSKKKTNDINSGKNGERLHIAKGKKKLQRERERAKRTALSEDKYAQHGFQTPQDTPVYKVQISESNPIKDIAQAMSVKVQELIAKLMSDFKMVVNINGSIDHDTATLIVEEMGHVPVAVDQESIESQLVGTTQDEHPNFPRPPVVAVMGHVDHGKTTLLDSIRSTKVAAGEKGGITQHIGAYMVETPRGKITFFDTPGHEAFAAMRVRGAKATDIVILVVAADDGVKPQTVEAINHARNAEVPIIVAINKIDKTKSDANRVLRELTEYNVIAESLGGAVPVAEISALKCTGIDNLLELVQLQAELMDQPLEAPIEGPASGVVVEARVDRGRGAVVTVLVQKGTLNVRDNVVAGMQRGKIRELTDYKGHRVEQATPSEPIEIMGFKEPPSVGDTFICTPDEKTAQRLIEFRSQQKKDPGTRSDELVFDLSNDKKVVYLLIKADVSGSAEALSEAVRNLSTEEVEVRVVHEMVGGINQSDVNLAIAAGASIIAFNVRAESTAKRLIETNGIGVIYSGVIYEAIDAVKDLIASKTEPKYVDEVVATVDVRDVFKISKIGTIAGCYVEEGTVKNKMQVRVLRDNIIIHSGVIDSLRRFKHDVLEVKSGLECGIQIRNYHDVQVNDQLEVYEMREAN